MLSVASVASAQAQTYFAQDYYTAEQDASATRWQGAGAAALGLSGPVRRDDFAKLLDGQMPDGTQLGRVNAAGEVEHRAGYDLTFSAPKSVSVAALVGGDDRLVQAHRESAAAALAYIESECASARIMIDGKPTRQHTGNLIIASIGHDTNRAEEPQLHDHNVIMHATQSADGVWRSLGDPAAFYRIQLEAGQLYRSILAQKSRELGYTPIITRAGDNISFELQEVPESAVALFSSRSAAIEQYLAARGLTRETASAEQKQAAALATRQGKESTGTAELRDRWQAQMQEIGLSLPDAPTPPVKAIDTSAEAVRAVAFAIKKLAENNSVFGLKTLKNEAESFAFGKASKSDIETAIDAAKASGEVIDRAGVDGADLLTTQSNVAAERALVAAAKSSVGRMQPALSPQAAAAAVASADAASRDGGHGGLNNGQQAALNGLLSSPDGVVAIQGYAGTAKTNAVLANYARELAAQGFAVSAMAPTASAASTLGEAIKANSRTMQAALMGLQAAFAQGDKPEGKQAWILDEASLSGTSELAQLAKLAGWADARLVLVGDTKQLSSVSAGAGFRQLQESGTKTFVLDEIVRQKNDPARDAVYSAIEGDARAALDNIDRSGEVREITIPDADTGKPDREASRLARVDAIASDYASQTREARADSIIVAPGRDDREQINNRVRELLQAAGELGADHAATVLEPRGLGKAESREAQCYTPGDMVAFRRAYQDKGVQAGDYLRIARVDESANIVTLTSKSGKEIAWNPRQYGASSAAAFAGVEKRLAVGDTIKFTKNDREMGVNNGDAGTITSIVDGKASITTERGKSLTLDLSNPAHQHIAHAYAQTAFAAQGRTAKSVFVHAESHRTNLLNQQSFYVGISRATDTIKIYTDDRAKLVHALHERTGEKLTAHDVERPEPEREIERVEPEREQEGMQLGM